MIDKGWVTGPTVKASGGLRSSEIPAIIEAGAPRLGVSGSAMVFRIDAAGSDGSY